MKKLIGLLIEITNDTFGFVRYFLKNNLLNFAKILNLLLPYGMYLIGQHIAIDRGCFAIGGEIFFPVIVAIIIYYLRATANKLGKGTTFPVPDKRFTQVDDDGEVSVESKRIHEMILYVADTEDWLERRGLL